MLTMKISSLIILIGAIIFLIAALLPISRVFGLKTAKERLDFINQSKTAWNLSQVLFASGAIIFAVGVSLSAFLLKERQPGNILLIAATFLIIGALAWCRHVYLRAKNPMAYANGLLPGWHFLIYILLALAAMLIIGIALLMMNFPAWSGWLLIVSAILFFTTYILARDLPPVLIYLPGLVLAFILFFELRN